VTFTRGIGHWRGIGSEPGTPIAHAFEQERRAARSTRLAAGTLACSRCDAPVAIGPGARSLSEQITCPFCDHGGALREFLSLTSPTRPARVVVRVAAPARQPR
jgi:hypothetical protein